MKNIKEIAKSESANLKAVFGDVKESFSARRRLRTRHVEESAAPDAELGSDLDRSFSELALFIIFFLGYTVI